MRFEEIDVEVPIIVTGLKGKSIGKFIGFNIDKVKFCPYCGEDYEQGHKCKS